MTSNRCLSSASSAAKCRVSCAISAAPRIDDDELCLRPEARKIAAGIHARAYASVRAQDRERAIDRETLCDAAEIDPERPAKSHASIAMKLDVAPGRLGVGCLGIFGLRQQIPADELRRNARIEHAIGLARDSDRPLQHFVRARIDVDRRAIRAMQLR